jgi:aldose 1-epimerase
MPRAARGPYAVPMTEALLPGTERIAFGDAVAEIAPAIGGSLAAFYRVADGANRPRRDWLRAAGADAIAGGSALAMASFPLLPWCNRLRDGRFEWNGRGVRLPPNRDGSPHTLHGIGWQRPWQVSGRTARSIELRCEDAGDGPWPFAFAATQRYALDADGLTVEVALRNTGRETMPAGIGHHPYLPHRREGAGTVVTAAVDAMWLSDAEVMPTVLSAGDPAVEALRSGMPIARFVLDNNFTGFGREARVDWPDGASLRLEATPPLDFFVLYTPADDDVFVMEAVSNCTDWINLRERCGAAEVGGRALAPGETLAATTRFRPLSG